MKRRGLIGLGLSVVMLAGLPMVAWAGEAVEAPQAKLNELIVQYTLLNQQQHIPEAITVAQQALATAEQLPGSQEAQMAQVLSDLGYFYQSQHDSAKAAPLHQRALALRERAFHSDGPAVVQSLNNLAKAYRELGRHAEAAALLKRSLEMTERDVPPSHPALREALERYAAALRENGNAEEVKAIEARLKTTPKSTTGAHHQETP